MVNAFLKKAYLGRLIIGSRDKPDTDFATFPKRSFNVGWPKIFHRNHESERWLVRQRGMPCQVEATEGFMPTLAVAFMNKDAAKHWPPRNGLPRIEMTAQPEGRAVTSL
jgi:hypothetical protein